MTAVLTALGTMTLIAVAGWLLAITRVLGPEAPKVLARVVFTLSTPSLLVTTIGSAHLDLLLTPAAVSTWVSTLVVAGIAIAVFALLRADRPTATIGTLSASYLNAGNLGIPVAVYVLGDALAVVPTMLLQLLLLAPVAFAVGDARPGRRRGDAVLRALRSPLTMAALLGLLLALTGWQLPVVLDQPLHALAATAAPLALLTLGMSLVRSAPAPGMPRPSVDRRHWYGVLTATVLRTLVHPALAYLVAELLGVPAEARFAVVLMAALPTAQNVLVYAMQFDAGQRLARDTQVITTFASLPLMVAVVALLH